MEYYKIVFETVHLNHLHLYCNADPRWYTHTTQTVPNSQIPDEHWYKVERESTQGSILSQYNTLKEWEAADKEFVRNIHIFKLVSDPVWTPMVMKDAS